MQEYEKFKVGEPSDKDNWVNTKCAPFSRIRHVCHISTALNIIKENQIRPRLIFDKSKLRKTRIRVCWLSPNVWTVGYRYGNISFEFNINDFIEGKNFYWVESINYGIEACRILITDERKPKLNEYDPKIKNGPWWYNPDNKTHYYNGDICLEFMLEEEILLNKLLELDFVNHHSEYCSRFSKYPKNCDELGYKSYRAGAIFLARIITQAVDISKIKDSFFDDDGKVSFKFSGALGHLVPRLFSKINYEGIIDKKSDRVRPLVRAIISCVALEDYEEAKALASLLDSEKTVIENSVSLVAELMNYQNEAKLVKSIYE